MSNELKEFNSNGFYIAKSLLNKEDVISIRNKLTKTVNDQLHHLSAPDNSSDIFEALKELHSIDIDRYKKVAGSLWRNLSVYELMHSKKITSFLREKFKWEDIYVPGGQVVHIMAEELQIPNGYFGLVPHQDFPSVQGSLDGVVVWLPLVDVDKNNYPLEVIPGSNQRGLLPSFENSNSTWEINPEQYNENDFVPAEVNVGDVIFMSAFTIHRSSTTGTPGRVRLALSTRFDNADESTFIERCYPTAYIRNVHREQYFKNFPTEIDINNIFDVK